MKGKKSLLLVGVICLVTALLISGCVPAGPPAPAAEPIKIGALFDYTGPCADLGPRFQDGAELAFEEANYEVAGRPLQLIIEDGATDVGVTLDKLKKLAEVDGVHACIGPLMGDAHLAIAPYAAQNKILMTTLFNGMDECIPYGNWIIYPNSCVLQQIPLGWYAYDELGCRTMAIIGSDYAGGWGYMAGAKYGFEQRGGEVLQEQWAPIGTADFGPYLAALRKDVDCCAWFFPNTTEVVRFVTQYKEFGIEVTSLSTTVEGDMPTPVLEELGETVLGLLGSEAYPSYRDDPVNNKFVQAMMAKTGVRPGAIEQNAYTMAKLILTGLGITNGDDSFDKLWPAVLSVQMDTPAGPLSLTPEGVGIADTYMCQAKVIEGVYVWDPIFRYAQVRDPRPPGWTLVPPH